MSAVVEYLFVVNEAAGPGHGFTARLVDDAARALGGARRVSCASPDEVRALVRDLPAGAVPVAVGGDGTVNRLAEALRAESAAARPWGVLPAGTGNAFAHSLGIRNPAEAVEALLGGSVVAIDAMATSCPDVPLALVSLSTGFEGSFLRRLAARRARSRIWSAAIGLAASAGRRRRGVRLIADGEEILSPEERSYSAGFYNMRCYAFGRAMVPEADPRDGLAHAVVYRDASGYWRAIGGRDPARSPGLRRAFRRARLETEHAVQFDGEAAPPGRYDVWVEPAALRVFARR
ncbi:MAG: diacylglycerol/lipid kinase family protein [Bacteroidota bacterium]